MFSIALLALASCSEDVTIAEDVDVAAPNEETVEVIKNDRTSSKIRIPLK